MASRSVNKVILLGHLGKDAETRFTPSGVARSTFTVATNRRWKDQQSGEWKEETDWHNVVLWRSENLANYLLKGKQVYVEGRLQTRSYDDKEGQKRYMTEVVADDLILLEVTFISGRPKEKRLALLTAFNENVVPAAGISPDDLMITLYEVPGENISFGQGLAQRAHISNASQK